MVVAVIDLLVVVVVVANGVAHDAEEPVPSVKKTRYNLKISLKDYI